MTIKKFVTDMNVENARKIGAKDIKPRKKKIMINIPGEGKEDISNYNKTQRKDLYNHIVDENTSRDARIKYKKRMGII
jgi:hypothetical protein